jgi:hypothetical protein
MITKLHSALTEKDKQFLLSVKRGDADWNNFAIPAAEKLPAVKWKLHNLAIMKTSKREEAIKSLEQAIFPDKYAT